MGAIDIIAGICVSVILSKIAFWIIALAGSSKRSSKRGPARDKQV